MEFKGNDVKWNDMIWHEMIWCDMIIYIYIWYLWFDMICTICINMYCAVQAVHIDVVMVYFCFLEKQSWWPHVCKDVNMFNERFFRHRMGCGVLKMTRTPQKKWIDSCPPKKNHLPTKKIHGEFKETDCSWFLIISPIFLCNRSRLRGASGTFQEAPKSSVVGMRCRVPSRVSMVRHMHWWFVHGHTKGRRQSDVHRCPSWFMWHQMTGPVILHSKFIPEVRECSRSCRQTGSNAYNLWWTSVN